MWEIGRSTSCRGCDPEGEKVTDCKSHENEKKASPFPEMPFIDRKKTKEEKKKSLQIKARTMNEVKSLPWSLCRVLSVCNFLHNCDPFS